MKDLWDLNRRIVMLHIANQDREKRIADEFKARDISEKEWVEIEQKTADILGTYVHSLGSESYVVSYTHGEIVVEKAGIELGTPIPDGIALPGEPGGKCCNGNGKAKCAHLAAIDDFEIDVDELAAQNAFRDRYTGALKISGDPDTWPDYTDEERYGVVEAAHAAVEVGSIDQEVS